MSYSLIYTKTARGVEEVRARRAGLTAAARRVLILIDGKRSEHELRLVVREGELESALVTLRAQGLIEECALTDRPGRGLDDDPPTVPLAPGGLALDLGVPAEPAKAPPTLRLAIFEADRRAAAAGGGDDRHPTDAQRTAGGPRGDRRRARGRQAGGGAGAVRPPRPLRRGAGGAHQRVPDT